MVAGILSSWRGREIPIRYLWSKSVPKIQVHNFRFLSSSDLSTIILYLMVNSPVPLNIHTHTHTYILHTKVWESLLHSSVQFFFFPSWRLYLSPPVVMTFLFPGFWINLFLLFKWHLSHTSLCYIYLQICLITLEMGCASLIY